MASMKETKEGQFPIAKTSTVVYFLFESGKYQVILVFVVFRTF